MEPEYDGFQKESPFPGADFQVNRVKHQGCIPALRSLLLPVCNAFWCRSSNIKLMLGLQKCGVVGSLGLRLHVVSENECETCVFDVIGLRCPSHQPSYSMTMIGLLNHLSTMFRFHYHSQKVIGSLGLVLVHSNSVNSFPIGSLYGIFTCIWLICMVNVGKYTSPMDPMGFILCCGQSLMDIWNVGVFFSGPEGSTGPDRWVSC